MSNSTPLRIIFAGTPEFAAHHLQGLLDCNEHQVIAVYTQPDSRAGRGKKLKASAVKQLAESQQLPVYQPKSLKGADVQAELAALNADLMVVVAYGLLLPQAVLDMPRLGCINVHGSILPRWRGAAPIQRAIEAGDKQSGVTIMQMDIGLDTGAMLLKAYCDISASETTSSLHDKLIDCGVPALNNTLRQIANNNTTAEVQNDSLSCYASKISKQEALIDWQQSATMIARKIRAFNPFPIAYTTLADERIKIWRADIIDQTSAVAGTITQANKNGITVACGEGSIVLQQIQLPGGKALDISAVLNARAEMFAKGTQFK